MLAIAVLVVLSFSFAAIGPKVLPVGPVGQCTLSPSSIDVGFSAQTSVVPSCTVDGEEVPCPGLSWSATIGTLSGGPFSVTHNSGSTAGTGTLSAAGPGFSCSIPVTVRAPSSGGSGGGSGSTGGASYRTATTVSTTCAGKEGAIKVAYLVKSAPSAIVDVFYTGDGGFKKIFTQTVNSNATIPFTPPHVGSYELHVSLGADQTTATFQVPACTGTDRAQETMVNLQPVRELVFSKTIDYGKGISKEFKVYKVTESSTESYTTEVALTYANIGASTIPSITITDSVPKSVVSSNGQLLFDNKPSAFSITDSISFSWDASLVSPGQKLRYSYRFQRLVTAQMLESFEPPRAAIGNSPFPVIGAGVAGGAQPDLLASMVDFAGVNIPFFLLVVAGVSLLAVALFLSFVFGSKKRSYGIEKDSGQQ
ncbi:MAG: hypothetical protein QW568_00675 [Candidatus Anstonellaceae archaeon]